MDTTINQHGKRDGSDFRPQDMYETGIDDKHSNNGCLSILMVIALLAVIAVVLFAVTDVHAMEIMGDATNPYHSTVSNYIDNNVIRASACRTYGLYGHLGGIDAIDGLTCGTGTVQDTKRENEQDTSLHGVNNVPVTEVETVRIVEIPVQDDNITPDDTGSDSNDDSSELGNPGNGKDVGHAGEHCNQNMCENDGGTSGEHGKSDND